MSCINIAKVQEPLSYSETHTAHIQRLFPLLSLYFTFPHIQVKQQARKGQDRQVEAVKSKFLALNSLNSKNTCFL